MKRVVVCLSLLSCALIGPAVVAEEGSVPTDLIAEADEAFDRWSQPFEFDAYQERLQTAIDLWEQALELLPSDETELLAHVLNHLAEAYFELAEAYLLEPSERETAYGRGKDHALASLRLDPRFDEVEAADGFRAALRSASDVAAIFWYGNTLGVWLNYHQVTAILGGVLDVLASYERAIDLDETYFGGAPQRSMAALVAQAHFVIGKRQDECVSHYERAIEIDPWYLESYVNYAQHYTRPKRNAELTAELLDTALTLALDPEVMAAWPLYNELAVRRARTLAR